MEKLLEDFSLGFFVWHLLLFLGLVFFLKKYAWKPILEAVDKREKGIQNALGSAENAKKEMQNLQANNEKLLKEARAERETMLKEAREIKEQIIANAKNQAEAEADKTIKQAQEIIKSEKQAAILSLKNQVASLSIEIAEKVVKETLTDKNKQLKLVDDLLEDFTLN